MTIPEVQQLKRDCEETILNCILEFEKETGIIISDVQYEVRLEESAFGAKKVIAQWIELKGEI